MSKTVKSHTKNLNKQHSQQITRKEGRPMKEVIPPLLNNKQPREVYIKPQIDNFTREFLCENKPNDPFPEWPGDDIAKSFDFQNIEEKEYTDDFLICLPKSVLPDAQFTIKWLRPEDYIREKQLDNELKLRMSGRNVTKLRHKIRFLYYGTKDNVTMAMSSRSSLVKLPSSNFNWGAKILSYQNIDKCNIQILLINIT